VTGADWKLGVPFPVFAAAWAAVATFLVAPTYRTFRTPQNVAQVLERAKQPDRAAPYAATVFMPLGAGSPARAWSQYRTALQGDAVGRLVYGRVVRDRGLTVLQYWLFYYYNDWWNQHEADWEVAMIYLDPADRPLAVACSSHLGGTWRPWSAVEPVGPDKTHPTLYVARGSHAIYFNTADGVHDAVLRQPWTVLDFRGQLTVHGKEDSVGRPVLGEERYGLVVIPDDAATLRIDDPRWNEWWWLNFLGRWGARDGILSPPAQEGGLRWRRPVDWARDHCEADSGSWVDIVGTAAESSATGGAAAS
jgi:hypothetical protein